MEKMQALATEVQGKYDILGITETLLNNSSKTTLNLQGYHPIFRRDRSQGNEPGGGVALYASELVAASRKFVFELPNLETLCRNNHQTFQGVGVCLLPPAKLRGYFLGRPSRHI